MLNATLIALLIVSSLFLIVAILMHSGRGSGLSDMFGGGGGLSGGTQLERTLDKITVVIAVVWGIVVVLLDIYWAG